MFVELEPVREDPKQEQEDGETEEHQPTHDAASVPNFSSGRCHETMDRQSERKEMSDRTHDVRKESTTYIFRADSPSRMRASAVKPKLTRSAGAFRGS